MISNLGTKAFCMFQHRQRRYENNLFNNDLEMQLQLSHCRSWIKWKYQSKELLEMKISKSNENTKSVKILILHKCCVFVNKQATNTCISRPPTVFWMSSPQLVLLPYALHPIISDVTQPQLSTHVQTHTRTHTHYGGWEGSWTRHTYIRSCDYLLKVPHVCTYVRLCVIQLSMQTARSCACVTPKHACVCTYICVHILHRAHAHTRVHVDHYCCFICFRHLVYYESFCFSCIVIHVVLFSFIF